MAKLNKKEILLRLLTPPKKLTKAFWTREYKTLKNLMSMYPNEDFWQKVTFNKDWDSICILQTEYGKALLDKKYKDFNYKLPKYKKIKLTEKSGCDKIIIKKPKTTRNFLNE